MAYRLIADREYDFGQYSTITEARRRAYLLHKRHVNLFDRFAIKNGSYTEGYILSYKDGTEIVYRSMTGKRAKYHLNKDGTLGRRL